MAVGSTKEELKTELCSKCHPFYTGQQKLVDTAGRVDKFQEMRKKSAKLKEEAKVHAENKKKKPVEYKEKEVPQEVLTRAIAASSTEKEGKWGGPLGDAPAVEVMKEEAAVVETVAKPKKKKKAA